MKRNKHIFFVRSDFQYIVCKGIIENLELKAQDCIFVADRNTIIGNKYNQSTIYGIGKYLNFNERCKYYLKNLRLVNKFFRQGVITVYIPFQYRYASHDYNRFVYYEEGLSAYKVKEYHERNGEKGLIIRKLFVMLLAPFNKQVRGYLMGFVCQNNTPKNKVEIYSFSKLCYRNVLERYVEKRVITIPKECDEKYHIEKNSTILILDRLSEFGRPFNLDNYIYCIKKCLERFKSLGINQIYLKYHPADYDNKTGCKQIDMLLEDAGIKSTLFSGRLEYLAMQNLGIRFVGSSSTVLFYAPLLGKTNLSESFYKWLSDIDEDYKLFISGWGNFEDFFSMNVQCI